jgi:RND superfamily putative drug exporter
VVLGWIALAAFGLTLPGLSPQSGDIADITSIDNPALAVEQRSAQEFGFPLLTRSLMVQYDRAGLPDTAVRSAVDHAEAVARADGRGPVAAAVPVPNDGRIPGVRQTGTGIVTYLYPHRDDSFSETVKGAEAYRAGFNRPDDKVVGVTGTVPARAEQMRILNSKLRTMEIASLAAVLLIIGLAFRSPVAPLLTLATGSLSFLFVTRIAGLLSQRQGWHIPTDLEPLMVALTFGITTDYVAYFLSGMRAELAEGRGRLEAARRATATFGPIVAVAGITVVAGVSSLWLARSPAIRAFGPALAITVLVSVLVAVTLIPAAMAIVGGRLRPKSGRARQGGVARRGLVHLVRWPITAILVAAMCLVGLAALTPAVRGLHAGLPFIASLPHDTEVSRAARAAAEAFPAGVTAPTMLEIHPAPAVSTSTQSIVRLEAVLRQQPHVAVVVGPGAEATVNQLAGREPFVFVSPDGGAVRYLLLLDTDPLDATAVRAVNDLDERLPRLLDEAGLSAKTPYGLGGDTAAVSAVISQTTRDLLVVLVAALLINLLIMMAFLRAVVAPVFLLGCTVLSAAATLGLTVLVFQDHLGHPGITFFVPLAAGVLLMSLGSDYNLFAVGHVWEEARRRRLSDAMRSALPRSSSAITIAGIALAASLGTLALVPLRQFQELAFALVVGILIEALVVRTLLAPALLTLFGRFSGWPGHRLDPPPVSAEPEEPEQPAGSREPRPASVPSSPRT